MVADSGKEETFKGKQLHEIQTEDMIFLGLSFFCQKLDSLHIEIIASAFFHLNTFTAFYNSLQVSNRPDKRKLNTFYRILDDDDDGIGDRCTDYDTASC